jgi:hypothetical protein
VYCNSHGRQEHSCVAQSAVLDMCVAHMEITRRRVFSHYQVGHLHACGCV